MKAKRRVRLLVIDDEKDICEFAKIYFRRRNLNVASAQTGSKAIVQAKRQKPDIAIIDIHMSKGLSGIDILKKLLEIWPQCSCIMVTWDKQKAEEAKELGAVDYLIKPVELTKLEASVNRIIKKLAKEGAR